MVGVLQPAVEMRGDAIAGFVQNAKEQEEKEDDEKECVWKCGALKFADSAEIER